MIEDIRDWVMSTDTPLQLRWHGLDILCFHDGVHEYRVMDGQMDVALKEGFDRWGPDTIYYSKQLPTSKEGLLALVQICKYLTSNIGRNRKGAAPYMLNDYIDLSPLSNLIAT